MTASGRPSARDSSDCGESGPGGESGFAGHSLGGALATLAAERYPHTTSIYTFGASRVGNASFAKGFRVPAFRIVNNNDITAWVPPPWLGGFRHVGYEILITASGRLVEGPSVFFELSDLVGGYFWQARRVLGGDVASVAIDSIYDHSPLLYVRCLRQCFIAPKGPLPAIDSPRRGIAQRESG